MILSAGTAHPCCMFPLVFMGEKMDMCQEERLVWIERIDHVITKLSEIYTQFLSLFNERDFISVFDGLVHQSEKLKVEYFNIRVEKLME